MVERVTYSDTLERAHDVVVEARVEIHRSYISVSVHHSHTTQHQQTQKSSSHFQTEEETHSQSNYNFIHVDTNSPIHSHSVFLSLKLQIQRMGRTTVSPEIVSSGDENAVNPAGLGFHSMRDRFRFKRNPSESTTRAPSVLPDRHWRPAPRSHHHGRSGTRKFLLFPFRGRSFLFFCVLFTVFAFALASMVLQTSIMSVFGQGNERGRLVREGLKFGSSLEFVPWRIRRRFELGGGLNQLRSQPRIGIRPPKLALVSLFYLFSSLLELVQFSVVLEELVNAMLLI